MDIRCPCGIDRVACLHRDGCPSDPAPRQAPDAQAVREAWDPHATAAYDAYRAAVSAGYRLRTALAGCDGAPGSGCPGYPECPVYDAYDARERALQSLDAALRGLSEPKDVHDPGGTGER